MFFCKKKYLKSYQQALGYSWSLRYNGAEVGYFANDQVIVSETVIAVVAYDDMVEHVQVEQEGAIADFFGDTDIFRAGTGIAGGMVVGQYKAAAVFVYREFEDFAGIDRGTGQTAFANQDLSD